MTEVPNPDGAPEGHTGCDVAVAPGNETLKPVSLWRQFGFSLGAAGIGIGSAPVNLFLLFFLTDTLGVRPVLAGLIVALPKVWDVVVDPPMGGMVDQLAHRMGNRTPLLASAALLYCLSLYGLFSIPPGSPGWFLVCAVIVALVLSSISHTAFHVSHLALADDMTRTMAQRTSLLAFSGVTTAILTLVATALSPLLVDAWGGGSAGYSWMAAILAAASAAAFMVFSLATCRYPTRSITHEAAHMSWWRCLRATFHNHPFYRMVGFLISFGVSAGLIMAFVPYINQYVLHGGASGLAIMGSIVLVCTVAAMPLAAILARRFGEPAILRLGNIVMLCAYPLIFASFHGPIWTTWLAIAVFGLGFGGLAVILQSMTMEVARTVLPGGIVAPLGFYLGIFVSGQKMGQTLGVVMAGLLLELIQLDPAATVQKPGVTFTLTLVYTGAPFLLTLLGALALAGIGRARPDDTMETEAT